MDINSEFNSSLPFCYNASKISLSGSEERKLFDRVKCIQNIQKHEAHIVRLEGCLPACESRKYSSQVSSSIPWPMTYAITDTLNKLGRILKRRADTENTTYYGATRMIDKADSVEKYYYRVKNNPRNYKNYIYLGLHSLQIRNLASENIVKLQIERGEQFGWTFTEVRSIFRVI